LSGVGRTAKSGHLKWFYSDVIMHADIWKVGVITALRISDLLSLTMDKRA